MISSRVWGTDGQTNRFLSDFIIRSEQFARPYVYVFDAGTSTPNELQNPSLPWSYPDNLYIRITDKPTSDDLITVEKWDLVDNSILFYDTPFSGSRVYIEVATDTEDFGDTLIQPVVQQAIDAAVTGMMH